jgi:hypothetical protein
MKSITIGFSMIVACFSSVAHAAGWVTMHGTACDPNVPNPSVSYGNAARPQEGAALWNGGSPSVTIICPLSNHWGGGKDIATGLSLPVEVYIGSNASNSLISCTLYRQSSDGDILEETPRTIAKGSGWQRTVTLPATGRPSGDSLHNYMLQCILPSGSAIYNIRYMTSANKS